MNYIIKPKLFEDAKKNIQSISKSISKDISLSSVEENTWLFFERSVTGKEFNEIIAKIQSCFMDFNKKHTQFVQVFGQVYDALDSLDNEYLTAIIGTIKGVEEASNQAKQAQKDTNKIIEQQKNLLKVLEDHKNKLDELKHLTNIDEIWSESKALQDDMQIFKDKYSEMKEQFSQLSMSLKSLQEFANSIHDYKHIKDVDFMWEIISSHGDELPHLNNTIKSLKIFQDKLKVQRHLKDIDKLWSIVDEQSIKIKNIGKTCEITTTNISELCQLTKLLKSFQDQLNKQVHLNDIDTLWLDAENIWSDVEAHATQIKNLILSRDVLTNNTNELLETTKQLQIFQEKLNKQTHIHSIDAIWFDVNEQKKEIERLDLSYKSNLEDINKLDNTAKIFNKFYEQIKEQKHINDVDTTWSDVNAQKIELKNINSSIITNKNKLSELEAFSRALEKSLITEKKRIDEVYRQEHILDIDKLWISSSENCNNVNELKHKLSTCTNHVIAIQKKYSESETIHLSEINSIKRNLTKSNILLVIVLFLLVIELVQKYLVVI